MYDAMYFDQDGTCLICEEKEATDIDHCHKTGQVRGLLCRGCNNSVEKYELYKDKFEAYVSTGPRH